MDISLMCGCERKPCATGHIKWHKIFSTVWKMKGMKNKGNKSSDSFRNDRERNDALNKSKAEEKEAKLPGEYPPTEDIMNRQNMQRVGLDVENFSRGIGAENYLKPNEPIVSDGNAIMDEPDLTTIDQLEQPKAKEMESPVPKDLDLDEGDIGIVAGNESDVTEEDLQALGPKDLSMDGGEDEQLLKNRVYPVDMAAQDLDIPGSEGAGDVEDEAIGPEDEENDFYSLGGDRHEDHIEGK
jgi:hypothetical protein